MALLKSWGRAVCCSRPENAARGGWSGLEFHATALGFLFGSYGALNLPILIDWYGGVAFVIPLLFWVLVLGLPMVMLELYVGQYSGQGLLTSWRHMTPVFSGIGYAMFFIVSCYSIYVPVLIAPCIYYCFASFDSPLPWPVYTNSKSVSEDCGTEVKLYLLVCMLVVWVLVGLVLSVGPRSLGKVSYVTTILPLILLAALLARMSSLPGAVTGLKALLVPDWSVLLLPTIWSTAGLCVCTMYGLGQGVLQTLASYNRFNNDILCDSILFVILPLNWSLMWRLVHYEAFGYLAHLNDIEMKYIVGIYTNKRGPYAVVNAMADMPNGEMWARMYYLALLLAGLGMQFALVETLSISLKDQFPKLQKVWWDVTPAICVILFLLGIPLCFNNGYFLMKNIKTVLALGSMNILNILFAEILCVAFYGVTRYRDDLAAILGRRWAICIPSVYCGYFMAAFWYAIVPYSVLFLMISTYYHYKLYYPFTELPMVLFLFLQHISFLIILTTCTVWFGVYLCCLFRKRTTASPGIHTEKWGPSLQKYRDLVPHLATRAAPQSPEAAAESGTLLDDNFEEETV